MQVRQRSKKLSGSAGERSSKTQLSHIRGIKKRRESKLNISQDSLAIEIVALFLQIFFIFKCKQYTYHSLCISQFS